MTQAQVAGLAWICWDRQTAWLGHGPMEPTMTCPAQSPWCAPWHGHRTRLRRPWLYSAQKVLAHSSAGVPTLARPGLVVTQTLTQPLSRLVFGALSECLALEDSRE